MRLGRIECKRLYYDIRSGPTVTCARLYSLDLLADHLFVRTSVGDNCKCCVSESGPDCR